MDISWVSRKDEKKGDGFRISRQFQVRIVVKKRVSTSDGFDIVGDIGALCYQGWNHGGAALSQP